MSDSFDQSLAEVVVRTTGTKLQRTFLVISEECHQQTLYCDLTQSDLRFRKITHQQLYGK